jgi:hypothetical protein
VPTDPYVPRKLEDEPRQLPNLAPGVKMPPAKSWTADRPGDLPAGQPRGKLLGSPGPNVGYALTLTNRVRDKLSLAPHEHVDDAVAVVAELAMKRAASYGRAPVMADVDVARTLLGYMGETPEDFAQWRVHAVHGAGHHYDVRRALVDAAPVDILRLRSDQVGQHVDDFRKQVRTAAPIGA